MDKSPDLAGNRFGFCQGRSTVDATMRDAPLCVMSGWVVTPVSDAELPQSHSGGVFDRQGHYLTRTPEKVSRRDMSCDVPQG